jgi:hypothetical protein
MSGYRDLSRGFDARFCGASRKNTPRKARQRARFCVRQISVHGEVSFCIGVRTVPLPRIIINNVTEVGVNSIQH